MKDTILKMRVSAQQMEALRSGAKSECLTVSAFVLGILFPNEGKPLTVEQVDGFPQITITEPSKFIDTLKEIVAEPPKKSSFKRSQKCVSAKCDRMQRPTCTFCIQANSKGFA